MTYLTHELVKFPFRAGLAEKKNVRFPTIRTMLQSFYIPLHNPASGVAVVIRYKPRGAL